MPDSPPEGSLRALLWDVDGTLAETERDGHRVAFNRAFAEAGLPWRWDETTYSRLLAVSGGRERLRAFLHDRQGMDPDPALVEDLQTRKQVHYAALVEEGAVGLRSGVRRLIAAAAAAGLEQAIVTTSGRQAVDALLRRQLPDLRHRLHHWICGEDVTRKKPDPEAYRLALAALGLSAAETVAIEDSVQGLRAARGCALRTLITLSDHSGSQPVEAFAEASAVVDRLGDDEGPATVLRGPACSLPWVTLSYLEQLPLPS
jgi:HAD superfamily hydrolase (TIGR01509 family)